MKSWLLHDREEKTGCWTMQWKRLRDIFWTCISILSIPNTQHAEIRCWKTSKAFWIYTDTSYLEYYAIDYCLPKSLILFCVFRLKPLQGFIKTWKWLGHLNEGIKENVLGKPNG